MGIRRSTGKKETSMLSRFRAAAEHPLITDGEAA